MGVLLVGLQPFAHGVEIQPGVDQLPRLFGQQTDLRPRRKAVHHKDTGVRVGLAVLLPCQQRRVEAARQGARDGDDHQLFRTLVGRQPVRHVGAGGAGFALVGAQGLGHGNGIQRSIVQIFPLIGHDPERHTAKVGLLHGIEVGRRIHNDPGFHNSHSTLMILQAHWPAGFRVRRSHYIGFLKTCQVILRTSKKFFAAR